MPVELLAAPVSEWASGEAGLSGEDFSGDVRRSRSANRVTGMKRSLPRALSGITASKAETFSSGVVAAEALSETLEKRLDEAVVGAACTSVEDMFGLPLLRATQVDRHRRARPR